MAAYAPIFSLSVAMNFAYAASKPFRETMKSGFLHDIKEMEKWYDDQRRDVSSKITLLTDVDENSKRNINLELQQSLDMLIIEDEKLKEEIEISQSKIADETKPIYIYTAIFSLISLFFCGQESAYERFPTEGIQIILISTIFYYCITYLLKKFMNITMTAYMSIFYIIIIGILIITLQDFNVLSKYISNKHLLDCTLIVAFLPFVLSAIRLSWVALRIEISARLKFKKLQKKITEITKHINNLRESKEYFNNQVC